MELDQQQKKKSQCTVDFYTFSLVAQLSIRPTDNFQRYQEGGHGVQLSGRLCSAEITESCSKA